MDPKRYAFPCLYSSLVLDTAIRSHRAYRRVEIVGNVRPWFLHTSDRALPVLSVARAAVRPGTQVRTVGDHIGSRSYLIVDDW